MADTQSQLPRNSAASENTQTRFLRSLITVFKDNRDVLPNLPEIIECLIANEEGVLHKMNAALFSSRIQMLEAELEERSKEVLERDTKMSKMEKDIKERNEELRKQIDEKEEKIKEHSNRITSLERERERKEKGIELIKKQNEELRKQIDEKEERIKEYSNRKDSLIKEIKEKEEKIKECSERNTCLEGKLQGKEKEVALAKKDLAEAKEDFQVIFSAKETELNVMISRLRHAVEEHTSLVCSKDTEINEFKSRNEDLMQILEAKKKQLEEQTERLERLSQESSAALVSKNKDIERLKSRVASPSEKRVKQDQSKVEDTLSMNRQSKIEEDYKNFFDEARLDACDEIQSFLRLQEENDVYIHISRLACLIFETAFEQMEEAKEAAIRFCKDVSRGMIESATKMSRHVMYRKEMRQPFKVEFTIGLTGQELLYPRDVLDGLMLALKEAAQTCDLDMFVKDVQDTVLKKWNNWCQVARLNKFRATRHLLHDAKIIVYIKKCLRLTWRMVTQVPALSIEYNSRYLDKDHRKWGCHSHPDMWSTTSPGQAPREEIACYLWPGLLDGNGRLIRAGEVLCKTQKER